MEQESHYLSISEEIFTPYKHILHIDLTQWS